MRRPDQLFEAAERLDRLRELGRAIRAQVADTVQHTHSPCVFMNVHPRDLEDDELLSPSSPLARVAQQVVLEVTERASLDEVDDVRARLATLRKNGFRLAVDDLGAGYSSLTAFAQLQPDVVKLDMSLVRGVDTEPTKRKLIESMTRLCGDLGMLVVAEGVESQGERCALVQAGCDYLQGYYFARPAAAFPQAVFEDHCAASAA
jgi:EAL domain-containing protein (putative c-di-GMP-specific phosphodiesterase class I)